MTSAEQRMMAHYRRKAAGQQGRVTKAWIEEIKGLSARVDTCNALIDQCSRLLAQLVERGGIQPIPTGPSKWSKLDESEELKRWWEHERSTGAGQDETEAGQEGR